MDTTVNTEETVVAKTPLWKNSKIRYGAIAATAVAGLVVLINKFGQTEDSDTSFADNVA